ncbi:MAG: ATP-dependent transcriptional regulator, MalT-like, LuxR family, partial [Actinomycetia bacterium]|nr:ATP-dependent transcriptional regulator, MalT-like, LuxR family [Actinomycetes bacterium]
MLESLDRANLFVVPLDDSRRWYRYPTSSPTSCAPTCWTSSPTGWRPCTAERASGSSRAGSHPRRSATRWPPGDAERAADLVELAIPELRRSRQEATIRGWLDAIPDDVVRVRPVLAAGFIGALMSGGEFEGVEDRLRDVERWLQPTGDRAVTWAPPAGMVVVDGGELRRLPGAIEMYRAGLALVRGDAPATIDHARRAIDRSTEQDHLTRAGASALMGLALWGRGDLEAAHRAYAAGAEGLERTGYIADVL